jgi:hypothetical protein
MGALVVDDEARVDRERPVQPIVDAVRVHVSTEMPVAGTAILTAGASEYPGNDPSSTRSRRRCDRIIARSEPQTHVERM